jgi:hypothetical protein
MTVLRRLSTPRLLALVGTVAAAAVCAGAIAVVASGGGGATPPPLPLAQAVHAALAAPAPDGVSARVRFTNNLLPSTALLGGGQGSALLSGATGRLWARSDGHGRIELQSDAGDTQVVWAPGRLRVWDSSSNTVYELPLRQHAAGTAPTLADVSAALARLGGHAIVSGATPDDVAGLPAYTATAAPKANGGLFGGLQLSWDATHGVPLRVALTAKGSTAPVLELRATDVTYGFISPADVDVVPPAGTRVVELGGSTRTTGGKPVTGVDAVRAAVPFALVAPAAVGGRPLTSARAVAKGALLVYGGGPGALLVHERATGGSGGPLPPVLETPLGTVVSFTRAGVSFLVGGSLTRADVEAAAQTFRG